VHSAISTPSSRQKRVSSLTEWGEENEVKTGGVGIQNIQDSGLGLSTKQEVPSGSLVVTVPAKVTLSVESGGLGGPDDLSVEGMCSDRRAFRGMPWYAQFSLYLFKLNHISSTKDEINLQPWLESLPTDFDTPIRWSKQQIQELQYQHMVESVDRQQVGEKVLCFLKCYVSSLSKNICQFTLAWKDMYNKLKASTEANISWDDFLLGCETARSRAFSGGYTGCK
jgi:hypothetical protein